MAWQKHSVSLNFFTFASCQDAMMLSGGENFIHAQIEGKENWIWSFFFGEKKQRKKKQQNKTNWKEEKKSKPSTNTSTTANQQKTYRSEIKKERREEKKIVSKFAWCSCVYMADNKWVSFSLRVRFEWLKMDHVGKGRECVTRRRCCFLFVRPQHTLLLRKRLT